MRDKRGVSPSALKGNLHEMKKRRYPNLGKMERCRAFQCSNRIVMAQIKHLDDFLRGRILGRLERGHTPLEVSEELGIAQSVISRLWQRFQDDGNSVTVTGHIYRYVILEQHVRLFRGAMDAEFLFIDHNARPYHANIVDECLQSEDITRMDWPAYSPDLNPIEHVWDMLGRRIAARQLPPTCLLELRS
ncbi:uncharacterized protein TNCV_3968421 [Trichonephila clavipes]|nr:uncharacterized protein TNCV_3968421 [Trichonephila clavipes]